MLFLHQYIEQFRADDSEALTKLAEMFADTKRRYDVFEGGNPMTAFDDFVARYSWLGNPENKKKYSINRNLARNLPGALMQDYLLHLMLTLLRPYPNLDIFTEVRVPFGHYPIWESGEVLIKSPSERSDLAVGYLIEGEEIKKSSSDWPSQPYYKLSKGQSILPIITVNSKIRVSQSEFFDWLGREELMTKGNPHCLSIQVALRKEMDLSIVEAAQAGDKWFLLGDGTEREVRPRHNELERLVERITDHLEDRM